MTPNDFIGTWHSYSCDKYKSRSPRTESYTTATFVFKPDGTGYYQLKVGFAPLRRKFTWHMSGDVVTGLMPDMSVYAYRDGNELVFDNGTFRFHCR